MRHAAPTIALLLLALVPGCASRGLVPLQRSTSSLIAGMYQPQEVRGAVIRALDASGFSVASENGDEIVARYERRGMQLVLSVIYTPQSVQMTYLDSYGFRATEGRAGGLIDRRYPRIVEHLSRRIENELGRPAREAREHQLELARAQRPVVVQPYVAPTTVVTTPNGYVTSGGYASASASVTVAGGRPVSCEYALSEMGHNASTSIFCDGAEPTCAQELIYQGHNPSALIHCRGVDPGCSVAHLRGGGNPSGLIHCR